MKRIKGFLVLLFFSVMGICFAQNNSIQHTVSKGETVSSVSQRYKVTPYDIFRLNPDAKNGLKESQILIIPKPSGVAHLKHVVAPKETLFRLTKQYQISEEQLVAANPVLKENGLQIGQELLIPMNGKAKIEPKSVVSQELPKFHIVQPKETLTGLGRKYNLSVGDLLQLNPAIDKDKGPKIGDTLRLISNDLGSSGKENLPVVFTSEELEPYVVQPKETIFGISRKFSISQQDLLNFNPPLKEGMKDGMTIMVPRKNLNAVYAGVSNSKDLLSSLDKSKKKELVVLLPFNASQIMVDTASSIQARLRKDAFLNMTLDVYAGALMAVDSAKRLGLNFDVKFYDSQETRNSSSVASLFQEKNLANADAIIGPFYPQHMDRLSGFMRDSGVPLISPIRELSNPKPGMYESLPSVDNVKAALFDYIASKDGNMIAFIDSRKESVRTMVSKNYPTVHLAPRTEKGGFSFDMIMSTLSKDKTNYLILETASTGVILNVLNICNTARSNGFKVVLATLEVNDTFETEEVFHKIVRENIIFPSSTKYGDSAENTAFANAFKRKNNVFPNQYATRGFDVTFDVLLRLQQSESFESLANSVKTERLDSKFEYQKMYDGSYRNNGVYILQYTDDFKVAELN